MRKANEVESPGHRRFFLVQLRRAKPDSADAIEPRVTWVFAFLGISVVRRVGLHNHHHNHFAGYEAARTSSVFTTPPSLSDVAPSVRGLVRMSATTFPSPVRTSSPLTLL